jgi:hypothetical protein
MRTIGKLAVIVGGACCALAMPARAADTVYLGTARVTNDGPNPAACTTRHLKITVSGDRFAFGGPESAPIASGPVSSDGSFSATYVSPGSRVSAQVKLEGRIVGDKATGTMSSAGGCLQSFALTKQ